MTMIKKTKGVSLPLVIGLIAALMTASIAANQIIIRTITAVNQIDASNRAYYAAEGGIEDALYELSAHYPGYQTPDLASATTRRNDLAGGSGLPWSNPWQIKSLNSGDNTPYSGQFKESQKLVVSFYTDNTGNTPKGTDAINETAASLSLFTPATLNVRFSLPASVAGSVNPLAVDNDYDGQENEDGDDPALLNPGCRTGTQDRDCDGRTNEDGDQPMIYWKLGNGLGQTLSPIKGCMNLTPGNPDASEICERNFSGSVPAELNERTKGVREDGSIQNIGDFLRLQQTLAIPGNPSPKPQLEFLIVAPMEHFVNFNQKIAIPYFDYTVDSSEDKVALPYYTILSDGVYKDFKQSLTTEVTPRTVTPLFDFTIIQTE